MNHKTNSSTKSHAELIASYSSAQYKIWLDMAASEASVCKSSSREQHSDFYSSEEKYGVTEDSADKAKFL